ncbi:MAG: hypothetical protein WA364_23390, partial [Candidatus Nitrosopolaris sp.]
MKKSRERSNDSSDESSPRLHLRVVEAKHRDLGKRRARIDSNSMSRMGIEPGEIIELLGKRRTAVTAWPCDPEEREIDIIRIDGQTRKNAGVGLNDVLSVHKAISKSAKAIGLMPL